MNLESKIKSNKGVSGTDVVVAILIMVILGGLVSNMFYQLYYNTVMIRLNAIALNYAVNILEYTDKLNYDEVNNDLNPILKEKYNIPESFTVALQVDKYTDQHPEKEDIIKILTLTISYSLGNNNSEELIIKKLKVKEM